MPADPYIITQGPLKLKGSSSSGIKKKKSKKRKSLKADIVRETIQESPVKAYPEIRKTKAEIKFEERRQKKEEERILKKASKTHKEKVEEFNRHLDKLTEHFDIPKVSWTK